MAAVESKSWMVKTKVSRLPEFSVASAAYFFFSAQVYSHSSQSTIFSADWGIARLQQPRGILTHSPNRPRLPQSSTWVEARRKSSLSPVSKASPGLSRKKPQLSVCTLENMCTGLKVSQETLLRHSMYAETHRNTTKNRFWQSNIHSVPKLVPWLRAHASSDYCECADLACVPAITSTRRPSASGAAIQTIKHIISACFYKSNPGRAAIGTNPTMG